MASISLTYLLSLDWLTSPTTNRSIPVDSSRVNCPVKIAKPVPFNPNRVRWGDMGAALVGLSGPLSNLLLALVAVSIMRIFDIAVGTDSFLYFKLFIELNIAVFVFNMIPFPPLDGSRVLYAFAPDPVRKVMEQIEGFGLTAIFLFMFLLLPLLRPIVFFLNDFFLKAFGLA